MASNGIAVQFTKQGGGVITGLAVGRLGSQLLIQYRIKNGERRERWFPKSRYQTPQGDVSTLPQYRRAICKPIASSKPALVQLCGRGVEDAKWFGKEVKEAHGSSTCPACGSYRELDQVNYVIDEQDQPVREYQWAQEAPGTRHAYFAVGWESHSNIVPK